MTGNNAEARSLEVVNRSGERIEAIYCVSTDYPGWGDDILGNGYLYDGQYQIINFSSARYVKLKVYFSGGRYKYWNSIDLNNRSSVTVGKYNG